MVRSHLRHAHAITTDRQRDGNAGGTSASVTPGHRQPPGGPEGRLETVGAGWRRTLSNTKTKVVHDRVTMAAASLAYHGFLALFPAVIALLGIVTLAHVSRGELTHITNGIDKALPSGASDVFTAAVKAATKRASGSAVAVVVGVVAAMWAADSGMAALQQALDVAYEVPVDRKFLSRRLHGLPLMLATVVLGLTGAGLVVFGASIGSSIESYMPVQGTAFVVLWTVVRWGITVLAIMTLFSYYYFAGPNHERRHWQWVTAGGLISTAVFLLASLGFSFYVSAFGSYGRTYGSFAGVAILIFWMYLTALAVLTGAEVNAEIARQAAAEAGASPPEEATPASWP